MVVNSASSNSIALYLYYMCVGRAVGAVVVMVVLGFTGGIPKTLELTKYTIVPVLISIFYAAGYFPLKYLTTYGGDVSVFMPITGLYIVIPPMLGLLWGKETKNPAKLVGITLSFAAIALLSAGPQDSSGDGRSLPVGVIVVLVVVVVATWGLGDFASARVARHLTLFTICAFTFIGHLIASVGFGLAYVTGPVEEPLPIHNVLLALLLNVLETIGWYMFVLLGRTGEVSVFGPITSLYLFVPVVYGLVFGGEELTQLKAVGLALACIAVLLVGKPVSKGRWFKFKAGVNVLRAAHAFQAGIGWHSSGAHGEAKAAAGALAGWVRPRAMSGDSGGLGRRVAPEDVPALNTLDA